MLRLRGRLNYLVHQRLLPEVGYGLCLPRFHLSEPLAEGLSIVQPAVGVKNLGQAPLLVADRSSNPWEDYNYKSLAAVAHTPGWNGTPVVDTRGGWLRELLGTASIQSRTTGTRP